MAKLRFLFANCLFKQDFRTAKEILEKVPINERKIWLSRVKTEEGQPLLHGLLEEYEYYNIPITNLLSIIKFLYKNGYPLEIQDDNGKTPLQLAIKYGLSQKIISFIENLIKNSYNRLAVEGAAK